MQKLILILLSFVLLTSLACGSSDKKKPSQDAIKAKEVISVLEQLHTAYVNKDRTAMERLCTRQGFRLIQSLIKPFDTADVTFVPTLIEMQDDRIIAHISWQGKWSKGTATTEEKGTAVFVLTNNPILVDNVLRHPPFKFPE